MHEISWNSCSGNLNCIFTPFLCKCMSDEKFNAISGDVERVAGNVKTQKAISDAFDKKICWKCFLKCSCGDCYE